MQETDPASNYMFKVNNYLINWQTVYREKIGNLLLVLCMLKKEGGWKLKYFWPIANILKTPGLQE